LFVGQRASLLKQNTCILRNTLHPYMNLLFNYWNRSALSFFHFPEGWAYSRRFVRPSAILVRDITLKQQEVSTWNCVGRYISFGWCAVHKNHNSVLPNFEVIALCSFLYFELCPGHNSKTMRDTNMELCRKVDLIE
jgi:hypothetical protein